MKQIDGWSISVSPDAPVSGSEISRTGYPGSIQQLLQQNLGYYVICEFLVGTNNLLRREGILYAAGTGWITLYLPGTSQYMVCDIYAVKFVTFYPPGSEPAISGM